MKHDIETIKKQVLDLDKSFEFKCLQCCNCCRNREDILLTAYDIYRIAKHLSIKPHDVFTKYCETYIGTSSGVPVVRLMPKPIGKVCPLLKSGKCSVHQAKPVVCALFPLGRYMSSDDDDSINYFLQDIRCGGKGEHHTVREWLQSFNIPECDR